MQIEFTEDEINTLLCALEAAAMYFSKEKIAAAAEGDAEESAHYARLKTNTWVLYHRVLEESQHA